VPPPGPSRHKAWCTLTRKSQFMRQATPVAQWGPCVAADCVQGPPSCIGWCTVGAVNTGRVRAGPELLLRSCIGWCIVGAVNGGRLFTGPWVMQSSCIEWCTVGGVNGADGPAVLLLGCIGVLP
jgi:hypothetical protein